MDSRAAIFSLIRVAKFLTKCLRLGVVTIHQLPCFSSLPKMSAMSGATLSAKKSTIVSSPLMSVKVRPYKDFCQSEIKNTSALRVIRTLREKSQRASTDLSQAWRFCSAKIFLDVATPLLSKASGHERSGTLISSKISPKSIILSFGF